MSCGFQRGPTGKLATNPNKTGFVCGRYEEYCCSPASPGQSTTWHLSSIQFETHSLGGQSGSRTAQYDQVQRCSSIRLGYEW